MGVSRTTPDRRVTPTRALVLALDLAVAVFAVSTVPGVRGRPGFSVPLDGWLQGGSYVLCAVLAVLRPFRRTGGRWFWGLLAASVVLRAVGFVVFLAVVRTLAPRPYPSVADAAWLASGFLLLAALSARLRLRSASLLLVLDAVIGSLTVAGLAVALILDTLVDLTRPGTPTQAVATNLAYPVIDVALLVVTVGVLASVSWRPRLQDTVLVAGVVCFAVVDAAFLYLVSAGLYRPGTLLAALSLAATAAIAGCGQLRPPPEPQVVQPRRAGIGVPVALAVCVVTLVTASYAGTGRVPVVLLALALVVTIVRGVLTLTTDRRTADREIAATQEELVRFQALVEASNDFIAIARTDGGVLYVNPAGRRLVGLAEDADVTATTILDYLTDEGIRASVEVEQPAVVADGFWQGESTLRDTRGGPPVPVAINSFLMRHPRTGVPFALATVQRDISERLEADQAVRELADARQVLLGRLVQAQEDERARIAADVHDDSVQALAAVQLRLALLDRQLAGVTSEEQRENLRTLQHTVEGATARLRDLLFDLDSPALRSSLAHALEEAAAYVFASTDVSWRLAGDRSVDLPEAARVTAYRVTQEALVNVRRHARARQVVVTLVRDDDGVAVTVSDDGRGLGEADLEPRAGHLGLASMHDRATVAGGRLTLDSAPGEGTRVRLWLPVRPEPEGSADPAAGPT